MDKRISRIDNRLVYTSDRETLVIEPWGRDGLRVRVTPLPEIIGKPWALTEPVDAQANIEALRGLSRPPTIFFLHLSIWKNT